MKNYFEKKFELGFFEMNKHGEASPLTMLTLLEETAAEHCLIINHGLYDLIKQNIGWVLLSGIMKMNRYPKYKEVITIRTWLSKYSTVRGTRENIIYGQQGDIIGRARGLWVFYDIKRKRPVPIFDDIKNKWASCEEECLNHDIAGKIEGINAGRYTKEFPVLRSDVDMNHHVSNIRYLHWVLESIPEDFADRHYLDTIDGRFMSELKYGDKVMSCTEDDNLQDAFTHTIKTPENKICATGKTLWKIRA